MFTSNISNYHKILAIKISCSGSRLLSNDDKQTAKFTRNPNNYNGLFIAQSSSIQVIDEGHAPGFGN